MSKNWIVATAILMLGVSAAVTVPAFATTADNSTGDSSKEKQNQNPDNVQSSSDKEKKFVDEIRECLSKAKSDNEFSSGTEKCMNDVLDKYFVGTSRGGDTKDESRNENTDKDEN